MSSVVIHPVCEKYKGYLEKNAKLVALDRVDFTQLYKLEKIKTKNPSPYGYTDGMLALERGTLFAIGNKASIAIFIQDMSQWFKTSPIKKVTGKAGKYMIETENSFYKLTRVRK